MTPRDSNPNLNGKTPPYGYESPRAKKSGHHQTTTQNVTVNVQPPPKSSRTEALLARMAEPKGAASVVAIVILLAIAYHYRVEIVEKLAEITAKDSEQ